MPGISDACRRKPLGIRRPNLRGIDGFTLDDMKRFPNCVHKLFYEPLIITPTRHAALCKVLESRMAGEMPPMMPDEPDEDDMPSMQTIRADAIIPVHGVLTNHADDIPASSCGCGCDTVAEMIKMADADDSIDTVLF